MSDAIKIAAKTIAASNRCVVFSGAGMSKDSGIDVFRGTGNSGFWSGMLGKFALFYGGTPFGWNLTPGYVWSYFIDTFYAPIAVASPHKGYFALFHLSQLLKNEIEIITMNVDGLHQASGYSEDHVCEVHGSLKRFRCIKCSAPITIPDPMAVAKSPPKCMICDGNPRPDVTLFTEALPEAAWAKAASLVQSMSNKDVMIIVGNEDNV